MRNGIIGWGLGAFLFLITLALGSWAADSAANSIVGWSSLLLLSYYAGTVGLLAPSWKSLRLSQRLLLGSGLLLCCGALIFALGDNQSSAWTLITLSGVLFVLMWFRSNSTPDQMPGFPRSAWQDPLTRAWINKFDQLLLLDLPLEIRTGIARCLHRLTESSVPASQFLPAEEAEIDQLGQEIVFAIRNHHPIGQTSALIKRFDETLGRRNELIIRTAYQDFLIAHQKTPRLLTKRKEDEGDLL